MVYVVGLIKDLCNRQVTVHGTGFWHPCQNDGIFAKMRIAVASMNGFPSRSFKAINLTIFPFALSLSKGGGKNPNH